jgi:hypothetical protein
MNGFATGDWIVLAVAAYIAVMALARLMLGHRVRVESQLAAQVEAERRRRAADEQAKKANEAA